MLLALIAMGLAALLAPRLGVPRRWRWLLPALIWLGWLLVLLRPGNSQNAQAGWLLLGIVVVLTAAYARWLRHLRTRAAARLTEVERTAAELATVRATAPRPDVEPAAASAAPAAAAAWEVAAIGGAPASQPAAASSSAPCSPGSLAAAASQTASAPAHPVDIMTQVPEDSPEAPTPSGPLDEAELARYSRHILLHEIGGPGQRRLKAARVLVVGAGGLGAPVLQYLAAAGVGTLSVVDDDVVEASNLHRQVIHAEAAIGRPKVDSALTTLAAQNPHLALQGYRLRLTDDNAQALFARHDLILDGSDSFETRELVNRAAVATGKPLISGALTQWEGQVTVLDPARGAPCYTCLFPQRPAPGTVLACAVAGVAGPLPGVIGTIMALEALKEITGAGETLRGRLLIWDGLGAESSTIRVRRRPDCPTCGHLGTPTA